MLPFWSLAVSLLYIAVMITVPGLKLAATVLMVLFLLAPDWFVRWQRWQRRKAARDESR